MNTATWGIIGLGFFAYFIGCFIYFVVGRIRIANGDNVNEKRVQAAKGFVKGTLTALMIIFFLFVLTSGARELGLFDLLDRL